MKMSTSRQRGDTLKWIATPRTIIPRRMGGILCGAGKVLWTRLRAGRRGIGSCGTLKPCIGKMAGRDRSLVQVAHPKFLPCLPASRLLLSEHYLVIYVCILYSAVLATRLCVLSFTCAIRRPCSRAHRLNPPIFTQRLPWGQTE